MNALQGFLQLVKAASTPSDIEKILSVNISNPNLAQINELCMEDQQLNALVDSQGLFDEHWLAYNEVVISFIQLARDLNPWSILELFDLYASFLNNLSVAFNNQTYGHLLTPLVRSTIQVIIPMAKRLDFQMYYKENCAQPRLTYLALILLKMFNHIRSLLANATDGPAKMKVTIILLLGNNLCLIYFKLQNPLLCQNIFSNMKNANLKFLSFPANEQIQYRYYLARFYTIKYQFPDAYIHYKWCLESMWAVPNHPNFARILKYIIPVGILMGKSPNFDAIYGKCNSSNSTNIEFISVYQELCAAIKSGNHCLLIKCLDKHHDYLLLVGLYIPFGQKTTIILIRNLVRKVWLTLGSRQRLSYEDVATALRLSMKDSAQIDAFTFVSQPVQVLAAENVLLSLVNQNLLKGKLFLVNKSMSLAKLHVFPPMLQLNFVRFGHGLETAMNIDDKWMNDI